MIPSNDSIHIKNFKTFTGYIQLKNFPTTHTEAPWQNWWRWRRNSRVLYWVWRKDVPVWPRYFNGRRQFLASLKENQKSTSSVGINNDGRGSPISSGTTTHPSPRNENLPHCRKKRKNRRSRSKRHKTSSQQPEGTVILGFPMHNSQKLKSNCFLAD